jgi:hypothetical protein
MPKQSIGDFEYWYGTPDAPAPVGNLSINRPLLVVGASSEIAAEGVTVRYRVMGQPWNKLQREEIVHAEKAHLVRFQFPLMEHRTRIEYEVLVSISGGSPTQIGPRQTFRITHAEASGPGSIKGKNVTVEIKQKFAPLLIERAPEIRQPAGHDTKSESVLIASNELPVTGAYPAEAQLATESLSGATHALSITDARKLPEHLASVVRTEGVLASPSTVATTVPPAPAAPAATAIVESSAEMPRDESMAITEGTAGAPWVMTTKFLPELFKRQKPEPPQPLTISVKFAIFTYDSNLEISRRDFQFYELSAEIAGLPGGAFKVLRCVFENDLQIECPKKKVPEGDSGAGTDRTKHLCSTQVKFPKGPLIAAGTTASVRVIVKSFEGVRVWSEEYKADDTSLRDLYIEVPLQRPITLTSSTKRTKKLRGQVLELSKKCKLKDLTVVIQAKARDDTLWRIVSAGRTDSAGNFSLSYPFGVFVEAQALVSAMPNSPANVRVMKEVRNGNESIAEDFLYLLLKDIECPQDEGEADCDCIGKRRPARLPDQADLIGSDEYTQDIGGSCINLSTPNRTLSEFNYQAIVRTSDPDVANYTLKKCPQEPKPAGLDPVRMLEISRALSTLESVLRNLTFQNALPTDVLSAALAQLVALRAHIEKAPNADVAAAIKSVDLLISNLIPSPTQSGANTVALTSRNSDLVQGSSVSADTIHSVIGSFVEAQLKYQLVNLSWGTLEGAIRQAVINARGAPLAPTFFFQFGEWGTGDAANAFRTEFYERVIWKAAKAGAGGADSDMVQGSSVSADTIETEIKRVVREVGLKQIDLSWGTLEGAIRQAVINARGVPLVTDFFFQFEEWRSDDAAKAFNTEIFNRVIRKAAEAGAGDVTELSGAGASALPMQNANAVSYVIGLANDLKAHLNAAQLIRMETRYELVPGAGKRERNRVDLGNLVAWQDDEKTMTLYQAVTVATGHILHYKSEFKADGYSLGDVVYSLPLAPGQTKQIVVLDASHRLAGTESQTLSQGERLDAGIFDERTIISNLGGRITESLRGASSANTSGISVGFGTGGQGYGGMGASGGSSGGYGGSGSAVLGIAGGVANANSTARQDSSRDISQHFEETLRQSIMQNANAYRQLNASVVTTVEEGQRYGVTSEVVANHNHCHALTIMYFEVLRHYAIFQRLSSVEECVFVPLLMTNFATDNIYKWRDVLAKSLLPMPSDTYLQTLSASTPSSPQQHPLVRAFDATERVITSYANVDYPDGSYDEEKIDFIRGNMRIRVQLPRPRTRFDRIMSLPITKQIDNKALLDAAVKHGVDMASYAAKAAFTAGIITAFEKPPTPPNPLEFEVLKVQNISDAFMTLDANYETVPPAQAMRITNFKPQPISVLEQILSPGANSSALTFFADNREDQAHWQAYADILGYSSDVEKMLNAYFKGNLIAEWDSIFYNDIAPLVFEKIIAMISLSEFSTDFSSETKYKGGERAMRLNLTGSTSMKRKDLPLELKLYVNDENFKKLKDYITFTVEDLTISYSTAHYNGVLYSGNVNDDLFDGTSLYIPENSEEKRNPRKEDAYLVYKLIEHLNSNIEYYNKALWYNLDPDRRFMLLDGFDIQTFNDYGLPIYRRSLASVVKNELVTITGNALVFPVAAGYRVSQSYIVEHTGDGAVMDRDLLRRRWSKLTDADLDRIGNDREELVDVIEQLYGCSHEEAEDQVVRYEDEKVSEVVSLLDHYQPLTPIEPYRISVPTRGVFAEAVQGACNACEKIETDRLQDWNRFPNTDEPTAISPVTPPTPVVTDWSAAFKDFATPIVNIQNAPTAPTPGAGLAGLSELLGKSGVFKDITGLDANQQNVIRTYLSNQENAKAFGEMAKEMAMQQHNTQNSGRIMDQITTAKNSKDITQQEAGQLVKDHLQQQIDGGQSKRAELEKERLLSTPTPLTRAAVDAVQQGKDVKAQGFDAGGYSESIEVSEPNPARGLDSASSGGGTIGGIVRQFVQELATGALPTAGTIDAGPQTATIDSFGNVGLTGPAAGLFVGYQDSFPDPILLRLQGRIRIGSGVANPPDPASLHVAIDFSPRENLSLDGIVTQTVSVDADGNWNARVSLIAHNGIPPNRLSGSIRVEGAEGVSRELKVLIENARLDWLLETLDREEQRLRLSDRLAFLARVRKIFEPAGAFDLAIGRASKEPPLYPKGTPEFLRLAAAKTVSASGELIRIGHVVVGIEGSQNPQPKIPPSLIGLASKFTDNLVNILTWSGDLASVVQEFLFQHHFPDIFKKSPDYATFGDYADVLTSREQLIADIDGINMTSRYDAARSLADNLREYYNTAGQQRFAEYLNSQRTETGALALSLQPGAATPTLTVASRQYLSEVVAVSAFFLLAATLLDAGASLTTPYPTEVVDALKPNSPEVQAIADKFAKLIEQGLAQE